VLGWKKLGLEQSLGTRIVTYADDLVILCRKGKAEEALHQSSHILIRCSTRRSTIRRATDCNSSAWDESIWPIQVCRLFGRNIRDRDPVPASSSRRSARHRDSRTVLDLDRHRLSLTVFQ
jgi:hypothetical protein